MSNFLLSAVALMLDDVHLLNEARVVGLVGGTDVGPSLLVPGLSLHEELRPLVQVADISCTRRSRAVIAYGRSGLPVAPKSTGFEAPGVESAR